LVRRKHHFHHQQSEDVCVLSFLFWSLRNASNAASLQLVVCHLNAFDRLAVVVGCNQRVKCAFHRVADKLNLTANKFSDFFLDIFFLFTVVSNNKFIYVFVEFLLVDSFQLLQAVLEEINTWLGNVLFTQRYRFPQRIPAVFNIQAVVFLRPKKEDHEFACDAYVLLPCFRVFSHLLNY
jgi:hypothetical protein